MHVTGRLPAIAFFNPNRRSYIENPYPSLARLRLEDPVFFSRELDAWILTRYDDCLEVLRDNERYSSDPARASGRLGEHVRGVRGQSPLGDAPLFGQTDPPVHTRLRAIINRAFTPRVIESHAPRIEATVASLLDAVRPGEPFEFMSGLAEQLPVLAIGDLLGLSEENRQEVRRRATALMHAASDRLPEAAHREALEAREWLRDFLARFAEEHRDDASRPLIAILLEAEREGGPLTPDELLAFTVFLYNAGSGPTACLLGNGLRALLDHPAEAERLRAAPELLEGAVDEMLRYDSPTQALIRVASQDATIGRRKVRAGDAIFAMVGAANRDPEAFEEPNRFDPARENADRHLSYGRGPHFCLGAPLAALEARIAFRALLERFPRLEEDERGFERGGTFLLRGPRRITIAGDSG